MALVRPDHPVAKLYAKALFKHSLAQSDHATVLFWRKALCLLEVVCSDQCMVDIFSNPLWSSVQQIALIESIVCQYCALDRLPEDFKAWLCILAEYKRFILIPATIAALNQVYRDQQGVRSACVRSYQPLDDDQKACLEQRLSAQLKGQIQCDYTVDASLLGGWVIQVSDSVWDGSVVRLLSRLRRHLLSE